MVDSKKQWKAWLYLSPVIILTLVFTVWPIINTVRMAFLDGYKMLDEVGGKTFAIGIENFKSVIGYKSFVRCLVNTLVLCAITVPISTLLALVISVCLNAIRPLKRLLQTIYFLPYVTNTIAIGLVFASMFSIIGANFDVNNPDPNTSWGIVNSVIMAFGGKPINWINAGSGSSNDYIGSAANLTVLVVYIVWNALPFKILVLLGGLQSVNKQYYEAAKVDGTSRWRTFWRITVPMLSPMLAYVIITGFIGGFKEYSSVVGVFGDNMGPPGAKGELNTMVGYINTNLMSSSAHEGRASAAAIILFAIIFVVTMINMWVSKKRVHY